METTNTTQTETVTGSDLANAMSAIKWADAAGRSVSTMNRLWKKYFRIEDALKAQDGGWR